MLKLKLQYFGHLMWRAASFEKTLMLGKIEGGWEEKGTTEDLMVGWHHQLNGHKFEWIPGVGDGQGGLACCGSWGCRVGHDWVTELNWTEEYAWFSSTGRRWEGESGGEKTWSYFHLVTFVDRSCFKRKLTQVRKQCWEMKGYQVLLTSFEYIHPTVSETSPLYLYTSGFPFFSSQFLFFCNPKSLAWHKL